MEAKATYPQARSRGSVLVPSSEDASADVDALRRLQEAPTTQCRKPSDWPAEEAHGPMRLPSGPGPQGNVLAMGLPLEVGQQAVARLQRENADLRSGILQAGGSEPSYAAASHGEPYAAADYQPELVSSSVHLQAQEFGDEQSGEQSGEYLDYDQDGMLMGEDDPGASRDGIFQRLQHDRLVALCDLNSLKAKFELTLQTLRAILRLRSDATWADMLEHAEALGEGRLQLDPPPDAATEEADFQREQLEDRLEEQSSHIARLRELLQKQQSLLDMTASQIQTQHQDSKRQAQQVADLEHQKTSQQDVSSAQAAKIDALTAHNEHLQQEFDTQRNHAAQLEQQLRSEVQQRQETSIREESSVKREADRFGELQQQLVARDADIKRQKADCERQKQVIKELTDGLAAQNEAYDVMRERVEVHEAEHRRIYSYQARTPDHPRMSTGQDSSMVDLSSPSQTSARDPRRPEQGNSSMNGYSGTSGGSTRVPGMQLSPSASARGGLNSARQAQAPMDDEERDAFLSHFPMASRTERQMRSRIDGERRKKIGSR